MTKASKASKVRFDGIDVSAMISHVKRTLIGRRIVNIYDGVSDSDAFLLKLDGDGKPLLFLDSGIRFHVTRHQALLQQDGMPSPFCSKLRKHLRGLRFERVVQLGNYDRVVNFIFGTGESRHSLILELYARGNLILTKADYTILALLRSHEYDQVSVKIGQIYPVTYATSISNTDTGLLHMTPENAMNWFREEVMKHAATKSDDNKKSKSSSIPLKAFLLKPSSGVYHYGPSLLEHCILCAGLDPDIKITSDALETVVSSDVCTALLQALKEEGFKVLNRISEEESVGYILYQLKNQKKEESNDNDNDKLSGGLAHTDKVLEEFQPHLLRQHENKSFIEYSSFSDAVDDFYAHIGGQKQALRAEAAEAQAQEKLNKIRKDLSQRVETLQKDQEILMKQAQLIELNAENVDKALNVINAALDTGMNWDTLEQLVVVEKANQNPIALLIKRLDLENDSMTLSLPNTLSDEEVEGKNKVTEVKVSLKESAHGNSRDMFAKYRALKDKAIKTQEASTKALKAAEITAHRHLAEIQKKSKLTTAIQVTRKPLWFEKFHWFITSDNYLVIGGRDAHQNEILVKRYLRVGDAYLHADVHGAASCVLRAKRHRQKDGKTLPLPLSQQALREAGNFTICRSSAWDSKMVTSAWWVESHQVSKTAPSGEYLTVGSFMVRGKKNFLPPSQLEMGLGVLFRLGDDDSIVRHKNERRDFALLEALETEDDPSNFKRPKPILESNDDENSFKDRKQLSEEKETVFGEINNDKVSDTKEVQESNGVEEHVVTDEAEVKPLEKGIINEAESQKAPEVKIDSNQEIMLADNVTTDEDYIKEDQNSNLDGITEGLKKPKGVSAKERRLIKKYGSLEAAQNAIDERTPPEKEQKKSESKAVSTSIVIEPKAPMIDISKRGKKGKLKKLANKYSDQDDEDRGLALMALHGGEKQFRAPTKSKLQPKSENQQEAEKATHSLLMASAAEVAESLSNDVKEILGKCVEVVSSNGEMTTRWEKFDADVIGEQLNSLESSELKLTAANRLLELKLTKKIDNFSASLSGIIRTLKKYGHVKLDDDDVAGKGRKSKAEKEMEKKDWNNTLASEGISIDHDGESDDIIDDTLELSKLTGIPVMEDSLLFAIPVCAPYQTLAKYKYKIKLTPGSLKRGKAAKQCLEILMKGDGDKSSFADRNRELMKRVNDNDWSQTICSDVKIVSSGLNKGANNNRGKKGGKKA